MKETTTYLLRLPRSLRQAVELLSREDGTSINQFVATAVAEKISALETARFFAGRKGAWISRLSTASRSDAAGSRHGRAMKCQIRAVVISPRRAFSQ